MVNNFYTTYTTTMNNSDFSSLTRRGRVLSKNIAMLFFLGDLRTF